MTDAGPTPPTHLRTRGRHAQSQWVTAGLVLAALLVGLVAGRVSRTDREHVAQPDQPQVTASPSPTPTVSVTVTAAAPAPVTVTTTASAAPVSPVTVTATQSLPTLLTETIATPDCLRALDLADQGFGVAQRGFADSRQLLDTINDAISAVRSGDFGAAAEAAEDVSAGTQALSAVTGELDGLVGPYNAAREACVNR